MREIKFRAWCGDKMRYWGFIDDYFSGPPSGNLGGGFNPVTTPHMQFTGLQDKNGVDIYEGDVIARGEKGGGARIIIEWQSYMASFNTPIVLPGEAMHYAVIGNIYENPELLEERSQK